MSIFGLMRCGSWAALWSGIVVSCTVVMISGSGQKGTLCVYTLGTIASR